MASRVKTKAEKALESEFLDRVRLLGGLSYKWVPIVAGLPDRIVIIGGRMWAVELKTEVGELEDIQKVIHAKFLKRGVPVYVLYGKEGVRKWIAAVISDLEPKKGRPPQFGWPVGEPLKSQHVWR